MRFLGYYEGCSSCCQGCYLDIRWMIDNISFSLFFPFAVHLVPSYPPFLLYFPRSCFPCFFQNYSANKLHTTFLSSSLEIFPCLLLDTSRFGNQLDTKSNFRTSKVMPKILSSLLHHLLVLRHHTIHSSKHRAIEPRQFN